MIQGNITITGSGDVECPLCPAKQDDDGNPILKDGVAVELDGSEMAFCWKHLRAFVNMKRTAKPKSEKPTPLFNRGNGAEV